MSGAPVLRFTEFEELMVRSNPAPCTEKNTYEDSLAFDLVIGATTIPLTTLLDLEQPKSKFPFTVC